jgi:hypothetical protein
MRPALNAAAGTMTVSLPGTQTDGQLMHLLSGRPARLKLQDSGPPQVTSVLVDGQPQRVARETDLGRTATPESILERVADADNPLDPASTAVARAAAAPSGHAEVSHDLAPAATASHRRR